MRSVIGKGGGALLVLLGIGCVVLVAFMVTMPADAGEYHNSPLVCSDCHVMHASTNDSGTVYNGGQGYVNLLKGANTNTICLNCHASNGASAISRPLVAGSNPSTDSMAGGWFGGNSVYTTVSGGADYTTSNGHDLEVATNTTIAPGMDPTDAWRTAGRAKMLNCATCHDQHGNTNYRNLLFNPNTSNSEMDSAYVVVTSATGMRTDTAVWSDPANYHYDEDVSSFCLTCHEVFGPSNGYGGATGQSNAGPYDPEGLVDNSSGANTHHPIDYDLGATIGGNYNTYQGEDTMPLLRTSGAATPANNSVMCLTCHRAHGSVNDSALRWDMSTDTYIGSGSVGCQVCHYK